MQTDVRATILVIDDDAAVRQGITAWLRDGPFRVLEAEDGRVGLEHFRHHRPELILLDLRMPGVGGLEVLSVVSRESPDTPVIVVSGIGVIADAVEALHLGAWDYLTKPIADPAVLLHAVEKSLERARLIRRDRQYQQRLEQEVRQRMRELEEANAALRESEERFRSLSNASFEGIAITEGGRFVDANAAFERMFGYEIGELVGKEVVMVVAPEDREMVAGRIRAEYDGPYEHRALRKDGAVIEIEVCGKTIHYKGRRCRISAIRDVTQRKRAESALREKEAQLAHVSRLSAMGEMVAGIAHEVNQPFYSILNFAKASRNVLAAEGEPNLEGLRNWMDEIAAAAARAGDIIRRLRDFARKTDSIRAVADVGRIISDAIDLMAFEIRRRHVTLRRDLCEAPLTASVDPVEIQQVLVNLLRNACEALEEAEITPRLVTVRTALSGGFVRVSVADNGPGLPTAEGLTIFSAFVSTKPEGLGMGLAISKSIVESHGGELWAASNPDGGATFHFTLPLVPEGQAQVE